MRRAAAYFIDLIVVGSGAVLFGIVTRLPPANMGLWSMVFALMTFVYGLVTYGKFGFTAGQRSCGLRHARDVGGRGFVGLAVVGFFMGVTGFPTGLLPCLILNDGLCVEEFLAGPFIDDRDGI